jgi:hypothetical protein
MSNQTNAVALRLGGTAVNAASTVARHMDTLRAWAESGSAVGLVIIPADDRVRIRGEVSTMIAGSTPAREGFALATKLLAAFPQAIHDVEAAKVWLGLVAETLSDYPPEAAMAAIRVVYRTQKFRPAVAEVLAACEEQMAPLHRALDDLSRMDHIEARAKRLAEERAAREAEELRRQEEDRKWYADRETAFVAQFAHIGAEPGDFTFVCKEQRPLDRSFPWLDLIEIFRSVPKNPADPWPKDFGDALVQAAIEGRACKAAQQYRAGYDEANKVGELFVKGDRAAARALANEMAARPRREPVPAWQRVA